MLRAKTWNSLREWPFWLLLRSRLVADFVSAGWLLCNCDLRLNTMKAFVLRTEWWMRWSHTLKYSIFRESRNVSSHRISRSCREYVCLFVWYDFGAIALCKFPNRDMWVRIWVEYVWILILCFILLAIWQWRTEAEGIGGLRLWTTYLSITSQTKDTSIN